MGCTHNKLSYHHPSLSDSPHRIFHNFKNFWPESWISSACSWVLGCAGTHPFTNWFRMGTHPFNKSVNGHLKETYTHAPYPQNIISSISCSNYKRVIIIIKQTSSQKYICWSSKAELECTQKDDYSAAQEIDLWVGLCGTATTLAWTLWTII